MSEPGDPHVQHQPPDGRGLLGVADPALHAVRSASACAPIPGFTPTRRSTSSSACSTGCARHEPQLAASVERAAEDIEDFLRVSDFAYGVEQACSTDRWALVGEAAAFADPFYSPGSDFIGYSNTFATELVDARPGRRGHRRARRPLQRPLPAAVRARDLPLPRLLPGVRQPVGAARLLAWDFYVNHVGYVLLFTQNKLTDMEFMRRAEEHLIGSHAAEASTCINCCANGTRSSTGQRDAVMPAEPSRC